MRHDLTGFSMSSRPWNIGSGGPNGSQEFDDDVDQELGALRMMFFPQLRWTDFKGKVIRPYR